MAANMNMTASERKGQASAHPVREGSWSGYGRAVVHLAWARDDQAQYLLFGMVELRPSEFPIIDSSDEQAFGGDGMSRSCIHYRRFALSVPDAIEWYRRSMDGDIRLPVDQGRNPAAGGHALVLYGGPFANSPAWPTLTTCNDLDFAPDWMQGSRAHLLRPPRAKLHPRALAAIRGEGSRSQLESWLHFDLALGYLGAICLVAPNPLFRSIEKSHIDSASEDPGESIAYKLIARAGQSVNGTRLEVTNEGPHGRLKPAVAEFGDAPVQMVTFPNTLNKEGRTVTHPRYGLLAWNEPVPLVRQISVHLDVMRRQKTVAVPAGGRKKPSYTYEVTEVEDGGDAVIGESPDDKETKVHAVASAHRRVTEGSETAERWFQDAPEEAAQFIRDEIGRARHSVLIADPYFAGRELIAFGHAIRRPDVRLRVLSSALALKSKPDVDAATELRQAIETFRSYPAEPLVRLLKGDPPRLHDRFLVVDGVVWFSGNSLNSIGERGAMIVRLSHPEPVAARLDGMWAAGTPFLDWAKHA